MRHALLLPLLALAVPAAGQPYLTGPGVALRDVLPLPPMTGSPEDEADRATFRATRSQQGTPRWQQAIADVDESTPAMLADFAPAAGQPLSITTTPVLARLLTRMRGDVAAAVNVAKRGYARRRPFLVDVGAICQPRAALENSYDYPSGHTSWGMSVALVLLNYFKLKEEVAAAAAKLAVRQAETAQERRTAARRGAGKAPRRR